MLDNFPKTYNPKDAENKWYQIWLDQNYFAADNGSDKPSYSILLPPPNITGILHFGHILNMTIQDLFIRRNRMIGQEVCWFPGIDHAGIATQSRVEKELQKTGETRYSLGREKFVEKVWDWKNKYGNIIFQQMEKLGVSIDWQRAIFTMDEHASDTVIRTFIKLFDDGLIYKGKRIINWSPLAQTALSDEEVEFREVKEELYTLRYYLEDGTYICCATARPETLFGDIAVAVNPKDERYKHIIGQLVTVPMVNRKVPIITDEYADPQFGTGCVKITPAHDPNDFIIGEKNNLEIINTINPDGTLNELTGEYNGLDRFKARKLILKKLQELDLIEKTEDYVHNVGFSQRGGEPIEPYLSDQWFVNMKPLAELALRPVVDGDIRFFPNHWTKTYEHWMNNIRDWCISRQLWWGHRIPVYYTEDGRFTAAINEDEARKKLNIDDRIELTQDTDVLDTWFSSWLWPLTTMHYDMSQGNNYSDDMKKFFPTNLLVTAPDIIFFWVARMIMATKYLLNEIPFKDVYFTSLIRDGKGRKLSKSLGNSPDPLNIIDKYGADAVRFTMLYLSPLGQDVRMDVDVDQQDIPSVELGRNFCNKIWNAARFIMMKFEQANEYSITDDLISFEEATLSDKWIISRLNSTISEIDLALQDYRVNEYSKILYDFIWRDFCDWYIEIVKIQMNNSIDNDYSKRLINSTIHIFEKILKLIHPIMPFISEEIWHLMKNKNDNESISMQQFPIVYKNVINNTIETNFEYIQNIVEETRKLRSTNNIAPSTKLKIIISTTNEENQKLLMELNEILMSLTKTKELEVLSNADKPDNSISSSYRNTEIHLIVENKIDPEVERKRINSEIDRITNLLNSTQNKLNNVKFIQNAKPEIIEKEKEKLESLNSQLSILKENLNRL